MMLIVSANKKEKDKIETPTNINSKGVRYDAI